MILILSSSNDLSTIEVTNWLHYYNVRFKVVYPEDLFRNINILNFSRSTIADFWKEKIQCELNEVSAVWCRKWPISRMFKSTNSDLSDKNNEKLNIATIEEIRVLNDLLLSVFPQEIVINHFNNPKISKLHQLLTARDCGLKIPETHIVSSKKVIKENLNKEIIAKSMNESLGLSDNEKFYSSYTSRVNSDLISAKEFVPSLVQEEIKKKYEVRSFIIGRSFFSMAIFSQENEQTEVDFRVYDRTKPNKIASYNLPSQLKEKIILFMNRLNLKTGSVDFIVDTNNVHYFLEVNPFGQFGMVSKPNNYNLEQEIAKYLINYEVY